jgi:hypothetical protein
MRLALALLLACSLSALAADPEPKKAKGPLDRGATKESEAAVEKGLRWLALHQSADGHWSLDKFNKAARTEPLPRGKVVGDDSTSGFGRENMTGGTALALLPFIAAGHTHKAKAGPYRKTVELGLAFLRKPQAKGGPRHGAFDNDMYAHCLAVMAVSEAYRLTKDMALKKSAEAGVAYLVNAQHEGGGWRYRPKMAGDTSVTGFALRALVAAKRAGLNVPKKTLALAERFLDSVTTTTKEAGYTPASGASSTMTAAATYSRLLLGANPRNAIILAGVKRARADQTRAGTKTSLYFAFYATQALYELGGKDWEEWNAGKASVRDLLVKLQDAGNLKRGNAGSWPGDLHVGGRLGATSFALLSLLVYHRERGNMVPPKVEP